MQKNHREIKFSTSQITLITNMGRMKTLPDEPLPPKIEALNAIENTDFEEDNEGLHSMSAILHKTKISLKI